MDGEPAVRFTSPADVAGAVGQDLGPTRTVVVDQARIDGFATVTEDRQWIHADPERAARGPYGSTIAHSYLTLSLVSVFLEDRFEVDGVDSRVDYGLNSVRLPAPVPVGSILRASGTVLGVREKGDGAQVNLRVAVEREGGPAGMRGRDRGAVAAVTVGATLTARWGPEEHGQERTGRLLVS